jgi:hypothetical protein
VDFYYERGETIVIERVISGGQTGADLGGWQAAKTAGIPTGGWIPKGCLTETGPRPEFIELYGVKEHSGGTTTASRYRQRAMANVADSDGTLCFIDSDQILSTATMNAQADCKRFRKLFRMIGVRFSQAGTHIARRDDPSETANWLINNRISTLNISGNRESKTPGIGVFVERYLAEVFRLTNGGVA